MVNMNTYQSTIEGLQAIYRSSLYSLLMCMDLGKISQGTVLSYHGILVGIKITRRGILPLKILSIFLSILILRTNLPECPSY